VGNRGRAAKPTRKRPPHRPRSPQSNTFAKWLDACGFPVRDVAKLVGVTPAIVYNLRVGRYRPGRRVAARIEAISDGAVSVASWDRKAS